MTEESQGGLLVPEVARVRVDRQGRLFYTFRELGKLIIKFGSFVYSFGQETKEVHPSGALWELIKRDMESYNAKK